MPTSSQSLHDRIKQLEASLSDTQLIVSITLILTILTTGGIITLIIR